MTLDLVFLGLEEIEVYVEFWMRIRDGESYESVR